MNISPEIAKKLSEIFSQSDKIDLKNALDNIDTAKMLEIFRQINPSDEEIRKAENKLGNMTKEEIMSELLKRMKGWFGGK